MPTNEVVCRGFAMPHSPRVHLGRAWMLDSGRGQLVTVDPAKGTWDVVTAFPGYTRGLAFLGPFAFVGLSRIRETSVFGGLPIAAKRDELKCGLGVVDLRTGQQVAAFQFQDGIEEIFDVQALPSVRCPMIRGPQPKGEAADEIWVSPPPIARDHEIETGEWVAVSVGESLRDSQSKRLPSRQTLGRHSPYQKFDMYRT